MHMKILHVLVWIWIAALFYISYEKLKSLWTMPVQLPEVVAWYEAYTDLTDFKKHWADRQVLFFHADRCSSCKVIEKDIQKNWVPEWIHIYEVNFDEEVELKEKYNVLTQTSFVEVDENGELLKRRVWGFGIDDIMEKLNDNEVKPWEEKRKEKLDKWDKSNNVAESFNLGVNNKDTWNEQMIDTSKDDTKQAPDIQIATFAGGCFWCLEWPFEAMEWVGDVISGYAWGKEETAVYKKVWRGKTNHREAVKVTYDANVVSYEELVKTFSRQIDPTDAWGQFADRWFHYTTAVYTHDDTQKEIAETFFADLDASWKFDEPIAVVIEPYTTFFPAEEEHQDYYLKQSAHYQRYSKWSGRKWFIEKTREEEREEKKEKRKKRKDNNVSEITATSFNIGAWKETLTDLQRKVIFEEWTEPPFNNKYRDHKEAGIYVDILDGTPLFSSTDKFDSGTGRPSFTQPIEQSLIDLKTDRSYGMVRTEVETANNTHLGHVFDDGPWWTKRYCINSAALDFVALEQMEELGYGEYMVLFDE